MATGDDFNDYFDGPDIEEKPKELTPEEKEIIEEEKDTIVVKNNRWKKFMIWTITVCVIGICIWGYLRYFTPYVSDAQKTGYIMNVEKRGIIFKTFEGDMISEFAIQDTSKVYRQDFMFSIDNDSLAQEAMNLQGKAVKVTLHYKQYDGMLPWRGSSRCILTGIDRD